jgi:hypothetical protein
MKKPTFEQLINAFLDGYFCVMLPLVLAIMFLMWVAYVAYINESYIIAAWGGLSGGLGFVWLHVIIKKHWFKMKLKQAERFERMRQST